MLDEKILNAFVDIVGIENVVTDGAERRGYAHDKLPYANFRTRDGALVGTLPELVLKPGSAEEVCAIVRKAAALGIALIPYGAGSGVLGGTIPLGGEAMIDLRRLSYLLPIDIANSLVTVGAGVNGYEFESALNEKGYTTGHLPQSLKISTVGGWAACRGGGQESSRYGKIEDIVVGLKAALPDGRLLEVRPLPRRATGPSILDLIVGNEGTLAIITELTLRVWKLPAAEEILVFAAPDCQSALNLARRIMQAGLKPRLVRLYDEFETATRTQGIEAFTNLPVMANIVLCGEPALVRAEADLVRGFASDCCVEVDQQPFTAWKASRYDSISQKWQDAGFYNDTVEVTVNWSRAIALYDTIRRQIADIHPQVYFSAHWSHTYPEGVCQYMTIRLPQMPQNEALPLHKRLWQLLQGETLAHGGSIAHHHGTGLFRGPWMDDELGAGMDMLRAIKQALDPDNLFNPGKLGLPARRGAIDPYRDRKSHV